MYIHPIVSRSWRSELNVESFVFRLSLFTVVAVFFFSSLFVVHTMCSTNKWVGKAFTGLPSYNKIICIDAATETNTQLYTHHLVLAATSWCFFFLLACLLAGWLARLFGCRCYSLLRACSCVCAAMQKNWARWLLAGLQANILFQSLAKHNNTVCLMLFRIFQMIRHWSHLMCMYACVCSWVVVYLVGCCRTTQYVDLLCNWSSCHCTYRQWTQTRKKKNKRKTFEKADEKDKKTTTSDCLFEVASSWIYIFRSLSTQWSCDAKYRIKYTYQMTHTHTNMQITFIL